MKRVSIIACVIIAVVVACLPAPAWADMRLFGTREVLSAELSPFPKWLGMLGREPSQREKMKTTCNGTPRQCLSERWDLLIQRTKGLPFAQQLAQVNRELNASPYIIDMVNWGMEDYWETPFEFYLRKGDCEDYAIAKYMTLKRLGMPPESMRIVVLHDNNLRLLHSVLVVSSGGANYILDNQIQQVVKDSSIHHYVPIYSINESHWWRHTY